MRVAVIDHGMGNLRSVLKALETVGADVRVTHDATEIIAADAMCFPGQGIFGRCMTRLRDAALDEVVTRWVADQRPYLGICLGMQVLFDTSDEQGPHSGLGVLRGAVARLGGAAKVPHIGWNTVSALRHPERGSDGPYYYFDHSYAAHPVDASIVTGWCEHGESFAARVETGSVVAVQFHPEKSGRRGLELLEGWVSKL